MKRSLRGVLGSAVVAVALLTLVACGDSSDSDEATSDTPAGDDGGTEAADNGPTEVTILYSRAAEQLSLWVAQDEGFFEENGLDVTLEEATGASQVPVAISGGSAQMGYETGPDFLGAVDQGIDLTVVSGLSVDNAENPRVALIASKDSGITDVEGIAGKRIAVPSLNTSSHLSTLYLLERDGVDTGSISFVEVPFQQMADALNGGRVDAAVAVHPFIGLLKSQGHTPIIEQYADADQSMLVVFLSADRGWAEDNPDVIEAVRTSLEQANEFIAAEPEASRAIMQTYSGLPPEIIEKIPFPNLDTAVTPEQLDFFIGLMKDQDLLSGELDAAELIHQ